VGGKRHDELGRRRFMRVAGGAAAGVVVAGGGPFGAMTTSASAAPLPPLPDQLTGGVISAPRARTIIPHAAQPVDPRAVEGSLPTALPFEFRTSNYRIAKNLPEALRPWRDRPTAWADVSPRARNIYLDASGVIMFRSDWSAAGYDHPVAQIQFALGCVSSYRTEKDPARKALFLERAKAQAERLIEKRVEARGAWYFPYPFDFTHAAHSGIVLEAPWYSGMAQGEALSLFTQLSQLAAGITAKERTLYRAAAAGAFASLLRGDDGTPWVVNTDSEGYLWIQEYPIDAPGTSDYTYNGMIFAMLGLWDYVHATGDKLAAKLYDGALTTIHDHFPRLRNDHWYSFYCDTHRVPAPTYHQHHIELFLQLYAQTGNAAFAHQHDVLLDDFPPFGLRAGAVASFAAGTHTLYRFDTLGASGRHGWSPSKNDRQLAVKRVTLAHAARIPVNVRRRIMGRGVYYRINSGTYAGWWVGEVPPKVFLRGEHVGTTYSPRRTAAFPANTAITCVRYGPDGATGAVKTVQFARTSHASFDRRAVVNGRIMVRITAGGLAGYWAPTAQVRTDGH
jgi:hypothetical protein